MPTIKTSVPISRAPIAEQINNLADVVFNAVEKTGDATLSVSGTEYRKLSVLATDAGLRNLDIMICEAVLSRSHDDVKVVRDQKKEAQFSGAAFVFSRIKSE